jgi:hypothetical protein
MSILTKPQARIPIIWVNVPGQPKPLPGIIDIEWDRYLSVLTQRAGGINGLSTTDVDAGSFIIMQSIAEQSPAPDIMQPACCQSMQECIWQTS